VTVDAEDSGAAADANRDEAITQGILLGALLGVYPVFVVWVATSSVAVDRAYWWFPALNTVIGTLLAMGGLWRVYPITEALG